LIEQLLSGLVAIEHEATNTQDQETNHQEHTTNERSSVKGLAVSGLLDGSRRASMSEEAAFAGEISAVCVASVFTLFAPSASTELVTQSAVGELNAEGGARRSTLAFGSSIGLASGCRGSILAPCATGFVHARSAELVIRAIRARVANKVAASAILIHAESLSLAPGASRDTVAS